MVEWVTVRDDATKTYQTVERSFFKDTISTMVFKEVSPSKSEVEWTVECKPKWCSR